MFKRLKQYAKSRRTKRDQDAYRRGFEWVMGAYYIDGRDLEWIKQRAEPFDVSVDMFEDGASEAIEIIRQHTESGAGLSRVGWLNLYKFRDTGNLMVTGTPKISAQASIDCRCLQPVNEYLGAVEVFVTKPRRRSRP